MSHSIKFKKKWNLSRVPFSQYNKIVPSGIMSYDQAHTIAKHLNTYKDRAIIPESILGNQKNYVFECHEDEPSMIVGVAQLKRKDFDTCILDDLIVDEPHRKKGYGRKLLEKVEERAGYRDFKNMSLNISESDNDAKIVFEKYGFTKSLVYYDSNIKSHVGVWNKDIKKPARKKKTVLAF